MSDGHTTAITDDNYALADPIDWECQIAYQRGIEAVNWAIPAVSMINFREAYLGLGGGLNTVYYVSQPPTPSTETLTANNQTPYATILMSTKDGPVVLDVPPASDRAAISLELARVAAAGASSGLLQPGRCNTDSTANDHRTYPLDPSISKI